MLPPRSEPDRRFLTRAQGHDPAVDPGDLSAFVGLSALLVTETSRMTMAQETSVPHCMRKQVSRMAIAESSPPSSPAISLKRPLSPRNESKAHSLGLTSATGLVIGSIVGTGVFTMPAVMAGAGTMSLVVLGVIAVGALLLGVLFGQLTKRVPNSDGGVYAYARHEFRRLCRLSRGLVLLDPGLGRQRRHRGVLGVLRRRPVQHHPSSRHGELGHCHAGTLGASRREPGRRPSDGVVPEHHRHLEVPAPVVRGGRRLVLCPLGELRGLQCLGGASTAASGSLPVWPCSPSSGWKRPLSQPSGSAIPARNVGRASVLGTAASAMLYVLVTAAVFGLVPHHALVNNGSPFVNAFQGIFHHGAWPGKFIAALAVISGIGALNGWTLIVTETSRAIAQDDLFPPPFAWADRKGTAWFGIVIGAALPSLLMLWRYETSTGLTVFTYLVDLTVVTVAIPYFFSAIAQLTYLVSRRRRVQGWLLARDLSVAGASVLFSMWVTFASGYQVVYQALLVLLAGLILYAFLNARRQRLGETAEPVDNPPMEPVARGAAVGLSR